VTGRLASAHASADDSPGFLLWQVTNRWQAAIRSVLRDYNLTHVQFVLLASLTWLDQDEPVTQRDLAAHAACDPMMTSQVLRALEARDLVARAVHPSDGRARAVRVTPAGASLANRANTAVEECDRTFFGTLGADVANLTGALRVLRDFAVRPVAGGG
jgi:DNA-binding MarR family transcriptional regulator